MKTVNMHEAKTHLSRLVRQVRAGTEREVIIAVDGEPAARLVAIGGRLRRNLGIDEGLVMVASDFDEVNDTIAATFKGRS